MNVKQGSSNARIHGPRSLNGLALVWLAAVFVAPGHAFASTAWWMMCDWCVQDSDFSNRALNAPGTHETVYVTNRDANETRKYNRTFIIDDLWDGVQQTIFVGETSFPAAEQAVFAEAVENATILTEPIPRDALVGSVPGIGEQGSVIGDISGGYINVALITAIRDAINEGELLPDDIQVSREAGIDIVGTGGNLGVGRTIRIQDLVIVIEYDDGSTVTVTRRASDGEYINWFLTDAEGNIITVEDQDGSGVPINPGSFIDREFIFRGPGSRTASQALADLFDTVVISCRSFVTETGAGVTCSRR